jgi:hypothetical protein
MLNKFIINVESLKYINVRFFDYKNFNILSDYILHDNDNNIKSRVININKYGINLMKIYNKK